MALLAQQEIQRLWQFCRSNICLDIQHVGSTAVPGLLAKPVIDIQIAVTDLAVIKAIGDRNIKQLEYVIGLKIRIRNGCFL